MLAEKDEDGVAVPREEGMLFKRKFDKELNWKEISFEVFRLDADLEELWDMAAGMLVPGTLLFQAWGLYLLGVALCQSDVGQWHLVLSVFFSCVPVPLLLLLGGITDDCMSEAARSKSIYNIVVSFTMVPDDKKELEAFSGERDASKTHLLEYIRRGKIGVQICGTLITKKLLIDILIMCVRTYLIILPLLKVILTASKQPPNETFQRPTNHFLG